MNIDDYIEKLEIQKEGFFYKCPYCNYTNADVKAIKKHIKSKHYDIIAKEVENLNKQNKPQRKPMKKQPKKKDDDYKDYMLLFAHKKKCKIYLDNGMIVEGTVKAKDRFNIMVLDAKVDDKEVERIIIQKGHIVALIPLEE
ncbi:TPA: C2H2-type zinc finger protein [Methanocaldococcus jannaschii]|uniref:Uncharacterized protein MJECS06 n=2 Tax=Methanocaldococcus jannaschii TaxID=2190 RepID=Y3406_METJA|nr:hypothetical protein [Methanocaldococcus jannaschii]Q60305.1 RecName: Full=Uncharacterized protein MJECS06 [Methanocaldococcus jannaschii DSM 2661]AAC37064.1 hypothetical protein MJ_ECS06 [Methanocaldococcus jannaschii DSM 2661]HII59103.1 C2H2-type zinc finger protein [Methanocaldococcus jannaschii]